MEEGVLKPRLDVDGGGTYAFDTRPSAFEQMQAEDSSSTHTQQAEGGFFLGTAQEVHQTGRGLKDVPTHAQMR